MPDSIHVVLVYGGQSGEHEISLRSAASVLANLDETRYRVTLVGMDKEGHLFVNDAKALRLLHTSELPVETPTSKPLDSLLLHSAFALAADVVFPMVHGPLYEDGCFQGLLDLAGIAYVGSGVLSSAICMDKDMTRRIACVDDVQSTRYRRFPMRRYHKHLNTFCEETVSQFGWPLFVKPCSMGSSVGIHKVATMDALLNAIADAGRYDEDVLIEAAVVGREIELAVLENIDPLAPPIVSIPGEICVHHPDGYYSYAAKYLDSDQTDLELPARLSETMTQRLQHMAADIFTRLECRGMARVDFFVDDTLGEIYFNEINTLPGFTSISMYPKLMVASGMTYSSLLDHLIELALMHRQNKNQLVTHYQ